jgi:hypothetical protein
MRAILFSRGHLTESFRITTWTIVLGRPVWREGMKTQAYDWSNACVEGCGLNAISLGARGRFSLDEKQQIVAESYASPRQASATVRRNGPQACCFTRGIGGGRPRSNVGEQTLRVKTKEVSTAARHSGGSRMLEHALDVRDTELAASCSRSVQLSRCDRVEFGRGGLHVRARTSAT